MACATNEFYGAPDCISDCAVINDDLLGSSTHAKKRVTIVSVDRQTIPAQRRIITTRMSSNMKDVTGVNFTKSIPLSPGEHKLSVAVCEIGPFAIKCARSIIRFNAEPNGRYRLGGSVSRSKDYADIWIEDLKGGGFAVDKVRVNGLRNKQKQY